MASAALPVSVYSRKLENLPLRIVLTCAHLLENVRSLDFTRQVYSPNVTTLSFWAINSCGLKLTGSKVLANLEKNSPTCSFPLYLPAVGKSDGPGVSHSTSSAAICITPAISPFKKR